ncbi:MAG: LPS assembly lipoprotein LptE [Magnetococcus sp. DMHC-8]
MTSQPPLPSLSRRRAGRRALLPGIALLACLSAACGYHFPGDQTRTDERWKNATLQIVGKGADDKPQLAFFLRDRLQARLGLQGPGDGQPPGKTLKITLTPVRRALLTEDRSGRANLYQVAIQAHLTVAGEPGLPTYPVVQGAATYYEPYISTSVQATQRRAETEAMEQLADTLVALLGNSWQPNQ